MSESKINLNDNKEQLSLDDGRRVKVLSPGMMVFKRFIRNKLAIAGIIILVFMFVFSFLGGVISPYRQDEVFHTTELTYKQYASARTNTEYRFFLLDGSQPGTAERANFSLAAKKAGDEDAILETANATWTIHKLGENMQLSRVVCVEKHGICGSLHIRPPEDGCSTWNVPPERTCELANLQTCELICSTWNSGFAASGFQTRTGSWRGSADVASTRRTSGSEDPATEPGKSASGASGGSGVSSPSACARTAARERNGTGASSPG